MPWLAGALIALWLLPPRTTSLTIVGLAATALIAIKICRQVWPLWLVAGLTWTWSGIEARLDGQLSGEMTGRDVSVSGWVDGFPRASPGQVSFSFRVTGEPPGYAVPSRLRLSWFNPPVEIRAGRSYDLTVRLKRPRGLVNPGGFDIERWLFLEGYGATGYVRSGGPASAQVNSVARAWLERREQLAARIADSISAPNAGALLTALALGERVAFTDEHWATFRRTGTSHLVAISGLHVGIVSALLFVVFRWLWMRLPAALAVYDLEAAALASFCGALFYAALAGFSIPTQRALIMLMVGLLALSARRSTSMTSGLSAAVLFVLLWDPLAPLSASFWLSFAAVALLWQLCSAHAAGKRAKPRLWLMLRDAWRVQWGVTIGLMPVVALAFGELSIVSPLVNFAAIPFFSFILVPLTLLGTATLYFDFVELSLLAVVAALADWSYAMLASVSEFAWSAVPLPELSFVSAALLCLSAAAALPVHALPGRYLAWIAMLGSLLWIPKAPYTGAFEATVLDVGHGLAVLVRTRRHSLLFDAGARYPSGFDSGARIVLPALRALGVKSLDAIIVSHADNDHLGGLDAVLEAFPSATFIGGPDIHKRDVVTCRRGQQWEWDGVVFDIVHPPEAFPLLGNDSSCVLRISTADRAVLITGDIERAGERSLIAAGLDLSADAVVVPHHGSATSSSSALTAATQPRYAIVSAAHANQWGFPKADVVARWESVGATTVVTGRSGAVSLFVSSDRDLRFRASRAQRRRAWRMDAG